MVTIAIASYNNAQYIERCVESVINQSYSNLQILIVDDGSTDDTIERLKKYKDEDRIRLIEKENGGLATVRQKALDEAMGEYICFIDADDYLKDNYVEELLKKISSCKSNVCVCSTCFENEEGHLLIEGTKGYACQNSVKLIQTTPEQYSDINSELSSQLHLGDSWNKMYEVDFIRGCGVKFDMPSRINGTDTLFNRLLALHAPTYSTIEEPLYVHVIYKNSAVHRKKKNLMATYTILAERTIAECKKLGFIDTYRQFIANRYASGLYFVHVDVAGDSEDIKETKAGLDELRRKYDDFRRSFPMRKKELLKGQVATIKVFLVLFLYAKWLLPYYFTIRKNLMTCLRR